MMIFVLSFFCKIWPCGAIVIGVASAIVGGIVGYYVGYSAGLKAQGTQGTP